jgi:transcriptional regulator GlxA family with amidase domain
MSPSEEVRELRESLAKLQEENSQLISRNLQMSEQLNIWYELRQRVNWLKEELDNNQRMTLKADMADDAELLAIIENRLEQEPSMVNGDFDAVQLAQMLGVSQNRLIRLFRNTTYKSADDYLDYIRLIRGLQMLREHPEYGIASVSEDAGFNSVRTFQRKCNEAVGMSPVEFRMLVDKSKKLY